MEFQYQFGYNTIMHYKTARIIVMGTPEITAYLLEGLISHGYNIIALIAQPDRPVGRKKILTSVPSKVVAEKYHIPTYQPEKIRKDFEFIKELKPDLILTLAYGQIVPQEVLDIPIYGCINLHGSLLPKYRGAAPMQYALLNNDKVTGFSLMEMVKEMDAGGVYAQKECEISEDDNFSSLYIKMSKIALDLALESLPKYLNNELIKVEQDKDKVSFAPSIKPEEERIDLNKSIKEIFGQIRALSEQPGAYLFLEEEKIKIFKAKIISEDISGDINTIVKADKKGLYIKVRDGVISILELQKSGKNKMDYLSFLNGNHDLLGKRIS